jgi:hypothetical protein
MAKINPIELQKHLKGLDYPAEKDDIVRTAQQHGADEDLTKVLAQLPDQQFETPAEISKAVGDLQ